MKYRLLSKEELQHLEGDLKAFLIINGVEGDLWKTINEQEPEKALALVELFSDQVLQTVYEKIKFLEFRSPDACMVFHCKKEDQELIALNRKTEGNIDLSTVEGIHSALVNHSKDLHVFKTTKAYMDERELEIHRLLVQGCVLSTEDFWNALEKVIQ
jgi:hypothetical protein